MRLSSAVSLAVFALLGVPSWSARAEAPPRAAKSDAQRLAELEALTERLAAELQEVKEQAAASDERLGLLSKVQGRLTGYLDTGFFYVGGDGSGLRTDVGNLVFPQYRGVVPASWVFMGDPLSTTVNSRGEPADTGESRAVLFDPINAGNRPSFILNSLGLIFFAGMGDQLTFSAALDVVPRSRNVSNSDTVFLGDFVDLKYAFAEYVIAPWDLFVLSLSAGKLDSVLGVEYRSQDAVDRLGVTPSLICRYTCGRPVGVKARAKLFDDALVAAFAITNGSHFVEMFPFFNEIDSNAMKTFAGRISYALPVGTSLEVGASGALGAQDNQPDSGAMQWHYGFDLRFELGDFALAGEFVTGRAPGKTEAGAAPCNAQQCLFYRGAYGTAAYRVTNWLTPYVRADWRDAVHTHGTSFVYVSKVVRATVGAQAELGTHVILKAEYIFNRELGPIPEFQNDIFTTSLVVRY